MESLGNSFEENLSWLFLYIFKYSLLEKEGLMWYVFCCKVFSYCLNGDSHGSRVL